MDLTKTGYSYTVNDDGTVLFTADCDGVQQRLAGVDLSSSDNLLAYLDDYRDAYIAGLKIEQVDISQGIPIGQPQQGS